MDSNTEGNLLEIMDLARTLRQEQLFIQQEQATFAQLTESLAANATSITKLAYIYAQQRQNLNDLVISRPEAGPTVCCRRAKNYENFKFIDAKKVLDYEHAITFEELFNHLYRSPYLLALSLATGDRLAEITPQHMSSVIHTVSTGIFGNAVNTKDVEMLLKLLRELIEIQIAVSDNPRRLLRPNSSAFARLYHRLNESMLSAKIFLTAALFDPIMAVLSDIELILDIDPNKILNNLSSKERLKRFGAENSNEYRQNVENFRNETFDKLHSTAKIFIDCLTRNWSLFPSTLRWLVQTMSHQLKQVHLSDKIIHEIIADMVFTHFICPAIVSPDILGIIDAPISEQVRFNLIQIGQIIQMLALAKNNDVDAKYAEIYAKFEANMLTNLIDMLLVSQTGEDVVAILSQQNDFERSHLLSTENELQYFVQFYRILMDSEEFDLVEEERKKLNKLLAHLPEARGAETTAQQINGNEANNESNGKERSNKSLISMATKATKTKIAKSMSFNTTNGNQNDEANGTRMINGNTLPNGGPNNTHQASTSQTDGSIVTFGSSPAHSSPIKSFPQRDNAENQAVLVFNLYSSDESKLQPLTEEEVLKMNSIGQEISNGEALLVDTAESAILENTIDDKSSVANGFDGIDGLSDVLRPLHNKTTRFSLSHDDASIGNSDNLEAVSEAPSNHSVTSSLELEENDQNDNLSDMVSANVSGRGTPNISGRDTPSSQVTDGGSVPNALPTPQMQKLISKVRSDIEDKFCKFEIKKFEGDETVSIISDTWSTDVLASDSETLDASERERDRNFSTPLIPSSVVLPGDNNFDVLRGQIRSIYLDATDQRSESNWSTDVLASDSEKLAEVDTDDNVSVTAKSDITDSGARSEQERDQLAAAISAPFPGRQQRVADTVFIRNGERRRLTSNSNNNNRARENNVDERAADGSASDRSQEDSAFYDAVNMYDEASAAGFNEEPAAGFANSSYYALSSLARSSVRTTNQYTGENSFQQEYKSSHNDNKEPFLATPRMRRQASAESSISNQSLNNEETPSTSKSKPNKAHHHHKGAIKKKKHNSEVVNNLATKSADNSDLIDFSDFGIEERSSALKIPPRSASNGIDELKDIFGNDNVEHRHVSSEQRTVSIDGRRNGIMAMKVNNEISSASGSNLTPSLRRHQSLNYENHEIMIENTISHLKRSSAMPSLKSATQTDDEKEQQLQEAFLLCLKTEELKLNDDAEEPGAQSLFESTKITTAATTTTSSTTKTTTTAATITTPTAKTNSSIITISNTSINNVSTTSPTSTMATITTSHRTTSKSTGAIPKSISFDASADKASNNNGNPLSARGISSSTQQSPRVPSTSNTNSGIFNKLKQGIFKHRKSNKSNRHPSITGNIQGEEYSHSSRSVSFSTNASEISLDLLGGPSSVSGSRSIPLAGYCDINEDILAKYRRKVSTSSEATTSDSIGSGGAVASGGIAKDKSGDSVRNSLSNSLLHDKAAVLLLTKKKIRTVLSKTDLHTNDFRHTTCSSASPLLTYLQIQLAQALNLQNFQQISYVSEAIRCISTLEAAQHAQLLEELQNDIQKRQHYLQYLMRFRQNILLIMENVEQYESRLRNESTNCNRYLVALCMRLFIEKRQANINTFQEEFSRLTVSDDKIDLIEEFIDGLMEELLSNVGFLYSMPEWFVQEARMALERILLQQMYQQVMFPNEDADLSRDSVLSEHIRKLQQVIRPSHPALRIRQEFLAEAPWSFAQQQLSFISAYKTPREKLLCVMRCISSIMSLLHMSSGRIPAADDLLPVLIYVVIKANPPYLLSTVEYISCFIGEKLDGEEQFHWTLFCSVVKYIKTMDYSD